MSGSTDDVVPDAVLLGLCALRIRMQWHARVLDANAAMNALDEAVKRACVGPRARRLDIEARRDRLASDSDSDRLNKSGDSPLEVTAMCVRNETRISISGDLDLWSGASLSHLTTAAAGSARHILVDVGGVSFIDVAGLRALRVALRQLAAGGVDVTLAPFQGGKVERLIDLMRLRQRDIVEVRSELDPRPFDAR